MRRVLEEGEGRVVEGGWSRKGGVRGKYLREVNGFPQVVCGQVKTVVWSEVSVLCKVYDAFRW